MGILAIEEVLENYSSSEAPRSSLLDTARIMSLPTLDYAAASQPAASTATPFHELTEGAQLKGLIEKSGLTYRKGAAVCAASERRAEKLTYIVLTHASGFVRDGALSSKKFVDMASTS